MDVYCIGEIVADFLPGESENTYIRNFGGAPANAAIACARNGLDAGVCCKVGDDDHGRFLEDTLKKENVRILCTQRCSNAVTTLAFVTLGRNGERSFTFARKPGADMFLSADDVKEDEILNSTVIHAGSCSLSADMSAAATKKALTLGHEAGKIVSFDINYRDKMWDGRGDKCIQAVNELLPLCDLLKISEEEALMLGGEEKIPEILKKNSLTAVVLTLGGAGAKAYCAEGILKSDGINVRSVDTTGAGDAFWGAFLSYLILNNVRRSADINSAVLKNALRYANISGALSVQSKGSISSLPTRTQIEKFFK